MYYFVTKKSLYNIPYKKVSLKFKQHSKIRKEHVLIKYVFLIRFYHPYLLHSKDVVKPYYIKGVRKQSFAEVLQNSYSWKACKIYGKTPLLESLFNNVGGLKIASVFLLFLRNFKKSAILHPIEWDEIIRGSVSIKEQLTISWLCQSSLLIWSLSLYYAQ